MRTSVLTFSYDDRIGRYALFSKQVNDETYTRMHAHTHRDRYRCKNLAEDHESTNTDTLAVSLWESQCIQVRAHPQSHRTHLHVYIICIDFACMVNVVCIMLKETHLNIGRIQQCCIETFAHIYVHCLSQLDIVKRRRQKQRDQNFETKQSDSATSEEKLVKRKPKAKITAHMQQVPTKQTLIEYKNQTCTCPLAVERINNPNGESQSTTTT